MEHLIFPGIRTTPAQRWHTITKPSLQTKTIASNQMARPQSLPVLDADRQRLVELFFVF
jgi:hypothetical protein